MAFKFYKTPPYRDTSKVFYVAINPDIRLAKELITSLYYSLWLPGWFGFNWDALFDCLSDLSWIPQQKIALVHYELPKIAEQDLIKYLSLLNDAASQSQKTLAVYFKEADKGKITTLLSSIQA